MKRLIHRSALLFNAFLVAGLILSYLSVYINPKDFWIVALFGLAYPYLLALNLIMIIYWSVQLKKEILISLITILIGWNNLQNFIRPPVLSNLNSNRRESKTEYLKDTGNTVMIDFLSYNVRLFNYYKWLETPDAKDGILRLISERKPDILCLQEIFLTGEKGTLTIDGLRNKTGESLSGLKRNLREKLRSFCKALTQIKKLRTGNLYTQFSLNTQLEFYKTVRIVF